MIGIYNDSSSTTFSVYTYAEMLISGPAQYYIKWWPSTLSGSFSIDGVSYRLEDYSGYFTDFSGIITVGAFARANITSIETNAYSINEYAFHQCSSLSYASLSNCRYLSTGAFQKCLSLSRVTLDRCSFIGYAAFSSCSSLSYVYAPECISVWSRAFADCEYLSSISLPECTYIGDAAFTHCGALAGTPHGLSIVYIPKCRYIGEDAFNQCQYLRSLDLPVCSYIGDYAFDYAVGLGSLTLRSNAVCALGGSHQYPLNVGGGSVYVPASLVNAYKAAQYWVTFPAYVIQSIPS